MAVTNPIDLLPPKIRLYAYILLAVLSAVVPALLADGVTLPPVVLAVLSALGVLGGGTAAYYVPRKGNGHHVTK